MECFSLENSLQVPLGTQTVLVTLPAGTAVSQFSTQFGIGEHMKHAFFTLYRQIPLRRSLCSLMSLKRIFPKVPKTTFYSLVLWPRSHSKRRVSPVLSVLY